MVVCVIGPLLSLRGGKTCKVPRGPNMRFPTAGLDVLGRKGLVWTEKSLLT